MMVMGFRRKRTLHDNLRGWLSGLAFALLRVGFAHRWLAAGLPSGSAAGGTITLRGGGAIGRESANSAYAVRWRMLDLRSRRVRLRWLACFRVLCITTNICTRRASRTPRDAVFPVERRLAGFDSSRTTRCMSM